MKINMKKIGILMIMAIIFIIGYMKNVEKIKENKSNIPEIEAGDMRVHFIDVGQGDCTFIEFPDNKTMLIDAGNKENADDIIFYIKSLNKDYIDYVVATHPHSDHIGGMAKVINEFDIGSIYMPKVVHNTNSYKDLLKTIDRKGLTITTAKAGESIYSGELYNIEILSPTKESYEEINNYSVVLRITHNESSFLFMGDAETEVEKEIINKLSDIDVLKVGHHGSSTSSNRQFINRTSPKYSIIQCGAGNDYGHPHKEILTRLKNSTILRNDELGTIIITSDGKDVEYKGN